MLNLLKFKKEGGRESYFRYIKESGPFVAAVGASVLYSETERACFRVARTGIC
jgi:hypothetical protein